MEKIRKPTTNIFRLLLLFIGFTTLILTPLCVYSYFYCYNVSPDPGRHSDNHRGGRVDGQPFSVFPGGSGSSSSASDVSVSSSSDGSSIHLEGAFQNDPNSQHNISSWSGGVDVDMDSMEEHNRLLLEKISRRNVAKLRRQLIYIYKLPPATDKDYEDEDLVLRRKHGKPDTDDYLTDDSSTTNSGIHNKTPHRFSHSANSSNSTDSSATNTNSHNNKIPQAVQTLLQPQHPYHSRFNITHSNVKGGLSGIGVDNGSMKQQALSQKSQNYYDNPHESESDSHKTGNEKTSGLFQPLPLPITTKESNVISGTDLRLHLPSITQIPEQNEVPISTQKNEGIGGESARSSRANKYYNTGHFRKSHAIIWDPHPEYIFNAFGHRFHLILNLIPQKHSFLTENFAITTHTGTTSTQNFGNGHNESFVWRENLGGRISGCFYNGFILGDPQSSVAVSLCHGMTGHIRTAHGSYFIEPLSPLSDEYMKQKAQENVQQNGNSQTKNNSSSAGHIHMNDEQEILHEIYQVGMDLSRSDENSRISPGNGSTTTKSTEEEYSYESSDNLQIGSATYEDEDVDDDYWLNPGGYANKRKPLPKSKSSNEAKSRTKRSMSKERYVELSVVTDSSMSAYHGENLNHYVLTLLSIVGLIYKDASIGNPVNIALVGFHVLPDKSFANNKWTSENNTSTSSSSSTEALPGISASEMLRNFCKWQKEHNIIDDRSPHHHDTALLLTRETICRNPWLNKCDTLGLAELGTMCDASYASCAIVQDNGLSSGFTIAHELGHLMNMPHDDDYKCQSFLDSQANHPGSANHMHQQFTSDSPPNPNSATGGQQHYVMSRMLDHNTYPWAWSRCSRHFLTEFLDAGHGSCLEDTPGLNLLIEGELDNPDSNNLVDNSTSPQQPGEIFSDHKQCELVFGPSSKVCTYMPSCKRLWCTTGTTTEEREGCRTQHGPWADGTPCGTGASNWCQRGACVKKDLEKLRIVNGGWGAWMEYGECSRSCGGGVRKSYRECDNPRPSNGGKYCIGPRVRYESCLTHECPNEADYRAEQCSNFDNDNFNIQGLPKEITWAPKYHGISPSDRCKLFCRVQGSSSYYLLREKVIDGTPCAADTFDVCVNGACLPAGCDRRLHSKKALDICGMCGGDGVSCRTSRGSFNETKYGYNTIIRIPAGSSNIDIRQSSFDDTARDDNYLALMDSNEEYILNGRFVVSMFRKTLHYGGSILEYSGSDEVVERINSSSRPIKSDLVLQVLSVGKLNPPDIQYQYVVSLNYNPDTNVGSSRSSNNLEEARWTHSDRWTSCSELCQGSQTQIQVCTNSRTGSEISSEYCRNIGQPQGVRRQCNTHCTLKWSKVQKACDCVHPNRTEVSFKCLRETGGFNNKTYISDGYCSKLIKGDATPDCLEECARPKWRQTQWSDCSARCGDGIQNRGVWCQKYNVQHSYSTVTRSSGSGSSEHENSLYIRLEDAECGGNKPLTRRKCDSGPCGQWRVDQWSPCSSTCGQGISRGAYACYLNDVIGPSDFCNHLPKPPLEKPCEADIPCVEWAIMSDSSSDNFVTEFSDDEFWSECTTRCTPSTGYRSRSIVCVMQQGSRKRTETKVKQVTDSLCTRLLSSKPIASKSCDPAIPDDCIVAQHQMHLQQQQQAHTHTQRQSWPFGSSSVSQKFTDTFGGNNRAGISLPLISDNTIGGEDSSQARSSEWVTGPWSACFKSGANAIQIREVSCPKERHCRDQRPTNSRACGVWFTGEWGNCNSTCENRIGQETRAVKCVQSDGESFYSNELEESDCLHPKPEGSRVCTSYCRAKGRWRTGPWGKCSRPCGVVQSSGVNGVGRGQRIRQVACVDESKQSSMLPEAECDSSTKPEATGSCSDSENQPCPVWSVSDWSECLAITTTASTTIAKSKLQTKKLIKPIKKKPSPSGSELCNDIIQDVWGHRERIVRCHDHNGQETPDYHCRLLNKRPDHSERCQLNRKHCIHHSPYRWIVGNWSTCSKHCGSKGVKTRAVECTRVGLIGKMNTTTPVDDKYCQHGGKKKKPKTERGCARFHCPFKYVTTEWTECSRTCGYGLQKRQVTCHRVNRLGWVDPDPANGCENIEKPKEYNYCMISESCANSTRNYSWKTEEWSECPPPTQFCGQKDKKMFQKRKVYCTMNGIRTPQRHCEKLGQKPIRKRRCPKSPCGWKNCLEVKDSGNYLDGEYQILVGGLNISIYCHGLSSERPKEYLTLREEAFSEIYDKRLIRPETCPRNGRRLDTCECVQDRNRRSGLTTWNKIRLNVTNLRVDTDDFLFAKSSGDLIPFGTSGDCYSAMNCPQGRFKIDLRRTHLAVNSLTTWVSQGHKPTMQITKASDNQKVEGKCGGYCGTCSPNRSNLGLKLEVVE